MNPCPKIKNYRNPKLLRLAEKCDVCQNCGRTGPVVACHSNEIKNGKGTGIKAHDIPAFLCQICHGKLDGAIPGWEPWECKQVFYESAWKTWLWCMQSGEMVVK